MVDLLQNEHSTCDRDGRSVTVAIGRSPWEGGQEVACGMGCQDELPADVEAFRRRCGGSKIRIPYQWRICPDGAASRLSTIIVRRISIPKASGSRPGSLLDDAYRLTAP